MKRLTTLSPKSLFFTVLAGVVVLIGVSFFTLSSTNAVDAAQAKPRPVFSDFDHAETQKIHITTAGSNYSLVRVQEGWIVPEKANLPVRMERMKELLSALELAEFTEQKTRLPERHDQLGLGAPHTGGFGAQLDVDGQDRSLVLGRKNGRQYGRLADENDSWRMSILFPPLHSANYWVDLNDLVPGLDAASMVSTHISHRGGMVAPIERDKQFLAEIFSSMTFEDVRDRFIVLDPSLIDIERRDQSRVTFYIITDERGSWLAFDYPEADPNDDIYEGREFLIDALSASDLEYWVAGE